MRVTPQEGDVGRESVLLLPRVARLAYRQQQGFYKALYRTARFYLPEHNLIIEIDGDYHDPVKDRDKDRRFLEERGIRTLRLTNAQVLSRNIPPLLQ